MPPRAHVAATVVVCVALAVCVYAIASDGLAQWDFQGFCTAAQALVSGKNPYLPMRPSPHLHGHLIYPYPPLTLYLFGWTTLVSIGSAKLLWLGLKLIALMGLTWIWHKDFEQLEINWRIVLFVALGLNATLLRDLVAGNISTFEQLGIWFGLSLLLRNRPYWAAVTLACVAQFKLLPVALVGLTLLVKPRDGWRPFVLGCAVFLGLLALNPLLRPDLTREYLGFFSDPSLDDRGIVDPSSLAFFRDVIDLTAYSPGLSYNAASGTKVYIVYLAALVLVLAAVGWTSRLRPSANPRLTLYFGCALFAVTMPRMKDYSYILMLIPVLFVIRDIARRAIAPDYFLIALVLLIFAQPQQTNVPGLQALIYMLQAYLPLGLAAFVLIYTLAVMPRARDERGQERRQLSIETRRECGRPMEHMKAADSVTTRGIDSAS